MANVTHKCFSIVPGEVRAVIHLGDSTEQSNLREQVGVAEFNAAVGYLSTWNMTFPEVRLFYNAREREITASYYGESGELGYCIGAVFNDDTKKFGFHS